MRTFSGPAPKSPSRPCFQILLLMALCALLAVATSFAQAPQAAVTPQASVAAPQLPQLVPSVEQFLAALSDSSSNTVGQICHSDADCGPHELCCYPCGIPDCNFICKKVKVCPAIP